MDRILVCIDGSAYATTCCQYASWIASRIDAEIELVYVTDLRQFEAPFVADLSGSLGLQPYQAVMGQLQELEEKKAKAVLDEAEKLIRERGETSRPVVKTHKTGFLVDSLRELEERCDLIVIGKRGENANFATGHLGSTMERVARAATKPCFVASRSFREISRVLLAYQDDESCQEAIDFLETSPLIWELKLHVAAVASGGDGEAKSLKALKKAESKLSEAGYQPVCQMLHGEPSEALGKYARENDMDLLVMGAYRHNRLRQLILGSSTTEMLRDLRLPTLLFRSVK